MKLSIITVCLNNRDFLEKTIRSVSEQTWKDFEYLVVDGASTDGTLELLETWKKSIHRQISEKDKGIYNAQNKGIRMAAGEYLLFLNAGDVFVNRKSLENFFSSPFSDDLVYGDIILEKQGEIVGSRTYPDQIPLSYWQTDFLCHQAVLHKKTIFDKHGLYNEQNRYASDHEIFFKVWLDTSMRIRHINKPIVIYNLDGVTGNAEARKKIIQEYRAVLKKHLNLDFKESTVKLGHYVRKAKSVVRKILGMSK